MENFSIFPIESPDIWAFYKKAQSCFWVAEEINLFDDLNDWKKMPENEKNFISMILAFFAQSDAIVNLNITEKLICEIPYKEAKFFYGFQIAMENIHNETYSLLIDTFIQDTHKKLQLFRATENFPVILAKARWAMKWVDNTSASVAERLIAFVIVEGLFFSGSFCSLFWLKERALLKGLTFSNELIARDEGLHVEFGIHIYLKMVQDHIIPRFEQDTIHSMMIEAVDIEKEFICESIPCEMIGMNKKLMTDYIYFVADKLLSMLGYSKIYLIQKCPFYFMENISMIGKTNFFERKNSEYMIPVDSCSRFTFASNEDF
jgi:ribonucleoside-diphosphate reductase beta chain